MLAAAAADFASALRFDRGSFAAQLGLASASLALGRLRDAEEALVRAGTLRPEQPEDLTRLHVVRAALYTRLGRTGEAIAAWQQVGESRVLTAEEQRALGHLHAAAGDAVRSADALERAVAGGATDL